MLYQITITLPGAEPLVSKVETGTNPHDADGIYTEALIERRVRRLKKRYPQADISWREVSNDLPRT